MTQAEHSNSATSPAWLFPLYLGGLGLLFIGERVLLSSEGFARSFTGMGLSALGAASVARLIPRFQAGGQLAAIERLLGALSVTGLLAIAMYFASTRQGLDILGYGVDDPAARDHVDTILTVGWVTLITVAVVSMLFAEFALHPMRRAPKPESRRVLAAATSGMSLALAAAYCSLFVYAASDAGIQADYSYFKTSAPSEATRNVLRSFQEPVKITAFFPTASDARSEVRAYLTQLKTGTTAEVTITDRYLRPTLAKELKVVSDGRIVFQRGDGLESLSVGTKFPEAKLKLKNLDRDVQEKLLKLVRKKRSVYLTVGHGELNDDAKGEGLSRGRSANILKKLVQKQNYVVKRLGLSNGLATEVPDDAGIVMVLGPTSQFLVEELASLQRYADGGGQLLLALDSDGTASVADAVQAALTPEVAVVSPVAERVAEPSSVPSQESSANVAETEVERDPHLGLRQLAAIVGLIYEPALLANERRFVPRRRNISDRNNLITNRFSSHSAVSTLSKNASRWPVLFPGTGSLEKTSGATQKVDFAVRALPKTFRDVNGDRLFDKASEEQKAFGLVAAVSAKSSKAGSPASEKKVDKPTGRAGMRAFVLADADVISDLACGSVTANQLLIMDAVRWLGGEESFAGVLSSEEDVRIEHTKQKDLYWFYGIIFGAPGLVLGLGLLFSRRSKRRLVGAS